MAIHWDRFGYSAPVVGGCRCNRRHCMHIHEDPILHNMRCTIIEMCLIVAISDAQERAAISDLSLVDHVTVATDEDETAAAAAGRSSMRAVAVATLTPHVIRYVVTPPKASSSSTWPPSGVPARTKTRLDRNTMSMMQLSRPFSTPSDPLHSLTRPVAGRAILVRPRNQLTRSVRVTTAATSFGSDRHGSDLFAAFQQQSVGSEFSLTSRSDALIYVTATHCSIRHLLLSRLSLCLFHAVSTLRCSIFVHSSRSHARTHGPCDFISAVTYERPWRHDSRI